MALPATAVNGAPTIRVANNAAAGVDVVVDVLGYDDHGLAVRGLRYHATAPTRILGTRQSRRSGPAVRSR